MAESWSERLHILDYDSAVAFRYHGRRQGFLNGLSRLDPALSIIFGSTAFASAFAGHNLVAAVAGLKTALASALNLAFGLNERARIHENLFIQWGDLCAGLAGLAEDDQVGLVRLEVLRAEIDARSPWQFIALAVICENEEKKVRREGPAYVVAWWRRYLANWLPFSGWSPVAESG